MARIDDILHDQHVAPADLAPKILEDPHLARTFHRVAVGGRLQKIHLDVHIELANQIGNEDERPPQEPHHHKLVTARERRTDLAGQLFDPGIDGLGRDKLVNQICFAHAAHLLTFRATLRFRGAISTADEDLHADPLRDPQTSLYRPTDVRAGG